MIEIHKCEVHIEEGESEYFVSVDWEWDHDSEGSFATFLSFRPIRCAPLEAMFDALEKRQQAGFITQDEADILESMEISVAAAFQDLEDSLKAEALEAFNQRGQITASRPLNISPGHLGPS